MKQQLEFDGVSETALHLLIAELEKFGANVSSTLSGLSRSGKVTSVSGNLEWQWSNGKLSVQITHDKGHFPAMLLIGGIRQLVWEMQEIDQAAKAKAAEAGR